MDPKSIFRLKITLNETDPQVLRVVDVPAWFNFQQFHTLIQRAMPWSNSHLFEFQAFGHKADRKGIRIGDEDMGGDSPFHKLAKLQLSDVITSKSVWIKYWYDFGDDWMHTITVQSIDTAEPGVDYPRLVEAANACPPEDIGGVWRYYDLQGAWKDRNSSDYWEARETFGRNFDPTKFDLKKAQKNLAPLNKIQPPTKLRIKPEVIFAPAPAPKPRIRKKKPE
jgi:hypothetical protein